MNRLLGVLLALVFAVSAATAGRGMRCEMAVHCGGCPSESLAWTSAVECPLVFPGTPESLDAERAERAPLDATPPVLADVRPAAFVRSPIAFAPGVSPWTPHPPGLEVLRI